MTDNLQDKITKGAQAATLVQTGLFKEAFQHMEREIIREWASANDPIYRDNLWHKLQNLADVRDFFVKTMNDGKVADLDLRRIHKDEERKQAQMRRR